jgi:hypothetical protein
MRTIRTRLRLRVTGKPIGKRQLKKQEQQDLCTPSDIAAAARLRYMVLEVRLE